MRFFFLLHEPGDDALGIALLTPLQFVDGPFQLQQILLGLLVRLLAGLGLLGNHLLFYYTALK